MSYPNYVLKRIEKWAAKLGLEKTELVKRYEALYSNLLDYNSALRQLKLQLERECGSLLARGEVYYAYLCGTEGVVDMVQKMRESVLRQAQDPAKRELLIQQGKLTPDGTVLDYRKKTGEPLQGEELLCRMLAIVDTDPQFNSPRLALVEARDTGVSVVSDLELFNFYKLRVNKARKQRSDCLRLTVPNNNYKAFPYTPSEVFDIREVVDRLPVYPVSDAQSVYSSLEASQSTKNYVMLQGMVSEMDLEVRYNRRRLALSDPEDLALDVTDYVEVRLRETVPVKCNLGDEIVAIGRLKLGKRGNLVLDSDGYIPLGGG